MRYLIGTKSYGLFYKKYFAVIEGFSDVDWNTLLGDSLSSTGYIFTLGSGAICWKSKKQIIIANSTMEAELIALLQLVKRKISLEICYMKFHFGKSQFHLY